MDWGGQEMQNPRKPRHGRGQGWGEAGGNFVLRIWISLHHQNFLAPRFREMSVKAFASTEIDKINTVRYKKDLENVKNILQSAIKELTLDRTLFKKIRTKPKTVEVTLKGEYFTSSGIEDPELIQAAKIAFEGSELIPIL